MKTAADSPFYFSRLRGIQRVLAFSDQCITSATKKTLPGFRRQILGLNFFSNHRRDRIDKDAQAVPRIFNTSERIDHPVDAFAHLPVVLSFNDWASNVVDCCSHARVIEQTLNTKDISGLQVKERRDSRPQLIEAERRQIVSSDKTIKLYFANLGVT